MKYNDKSKDKLENFNDGNLITFIRSKKSNPLHSSDLPEIYNIQYSPIKKDYNNIQRINLIKKFKVYGSRKIIKN